MHHIPGETLLSQFNKSKRIATENLQDQHPCNMMRMLSDAEVLSVAGGPEVQVGTGTDLQRNEYESR
ncbi:hypothetical protein UNDYM_0075 [Undibacterium sp. YM2]|uniref:hypothetical protein n=1 Tax=Undibacterium sp. YM2 TaxID=2058625 RepID=UPI001331D202|nr:hypothetical protein [Undibacterium sp. YM2]BBB64328.1 hypothetical protein UNDYM_0075 [Undibacterium sp. YM2]